MGKIYGYCRISTNKQNIERQVDNIKSVYPNADIRCEVYTGRKIQGRKELEKILKIVEPGDLIVFDEVSRMSRNAAEGTELYFKLLNNGIDLEFIKEPYINTKTYKSAQDKDKDKDIDICIPNTGKASMDNYIQAMLQATNELIKNLANEQIQIAFDHAQKEIDDLSKRTKDGIKLARKNGMQIGLKKGATRTVKKKAAALELIKKNNKTFGGTWDDETTMFKANISHNTLYKYKREILASMVQEAV